MAVAYKSNTWYIVHSTGRRNEKGRYIQEWVATDAKTKTEAKQLEAKFVLQRKKGIIPSKMKVSEFLELWLKQHVMNETKPLALSTQEWYQDNIENHINPVIGHIKLTNISVLDIDGVINACAKKGCKDTTLRGVYATMRAAFGWGVKKRLIEDNPLLYVDKPYIEKRNYKLLSFDEIKTFLEKAKTNNDPFFRIYFMAALTGKRADEISGLRIQDIDLENKKATIVQQVIKCGDHPEFGPPKNKKPHTIPLSDTVIEIIMDELKSRDVKKKKRLEKQEEWEKDRTEPFVKPWRDDYNLVFTNKFGGPVNTHNISARNFKNSLKSAGLPTDIKFHNLRHSFATMLIEMGETSEVVSELLNHADPYFTKRTYTHTEPTLRRPAVNKLDNVIFSKNENSDNES